MINTKSDFGNKIHFKNFGIMDNKKVKLMLKSYFLVAIVYE